MIDEPTWAALSATAAELPLPDFIAEVEASLPDRVRIDVWLWDFQQRSITSVVTGRSVERSDLGDLVAEQRIRRPLRLHGAELGLLTVDASADEPPLPDPVVDGLAGLFAIAIPPSEVVSDRVASRRRAQSMSLPAEMQWRILPPSQLAVRGAAISAAVEPAYDTGGDVYDYAVNGSTLFIAVLDARGHGLRAATVATVAASAMRRARRRGASLESIAGEVGVSIGALGDDEEFVSGVLAELDLDTGDGRWLSAGHLPPLVIDGGSTSTLRHSPTLPMGMVVRGEMTDPSSEVFHLQPGQSLVLYSDGIIENAALDDGQAIGEARFQRSLLDRLASHSGGDHVARAVVDDLLDLTGPKLRDDATLLVLSRPSAD